VTVVTDTPVVLNLCLLRQEAVLLPLLGRVFAPPEVVAEFHRLAVADARFWFSPSLRTAVLQHVNELP